MKELFYWPACIECVELFESEGFEEKYADCEKIDIGESTANMKRFLKYRTELEGYRPVREGGFIGIPTIVEDGEKVTFLS